jgi:hypothetical protein
VLKIDHFRAVVELQPIISRLFVTDGFDLQLAKLMLLSDFVSAVKTYSEEVLWQPKNFSRHYLDIHVNCK